MNIEKIKQQLIKNLNKKVIVKYNGNRNQTEIYEGILVKTYNYIFLINLVNSNCNKTFSYTDILIGNLELTYK